MGIRPSDLINFKKKLHPNRAENDFGRVLVCRYKQKNKLGDLLHKYCHVTGLFFSLS